MATQASPLTCVAGSVSSPADACGPSVSHLLAWPMAQVDEGMRRRADRDQGASTLKGGYVGNRAAMMGAVGAPSGKHRHGSGSCRGGASGFPHNSGHGW